MKGNQAVYEPSTVIVRNAENLTEQDINALKKSESFSRPYNTGFRIKCKSGKTINWYPVNTGSAYDYLLNVLKIKQTDTFRP